MTTFSLRSGAMLLFSALLTMGAFAQAQIRINAFGGYTFRDKFPMSGSYPYGGYNYNYTEGVVNEAAHFGGGLEFVLRRTKSVELYYQTQPTTASIKFSGFDTKSVDATVSYAMIGGLGYAPFNDAVSGYGGISLGAAFFNSDGGDATKFAFGGKLGIMINASESVGIKIGAQLLSPVQGAGGGFYFGTGGAGAGVSTYSSIYQFGFTGGLCFTLGAKGSGGGPSRSSMPPPQPQGGTSMPPPPPPPPPHN